MNPVAAAAAAGAACALLVRPPAESRLRRRRSVRAAGAVAESSGPSRAGGTPVGPPGRVPTAGRSGGVVGKASDRVTAALPFGDGTARAVGGARADGPRGSARPVRFRDVRLPGRWRAARRERAAPVAPTLDDVVTLLDRLAALLRAGLGPRAVWEHLAAAPGTCRPVCAFVAESLAAGGDPGRAVAGAAELLRRPAGRASLRRVGRPAGGTANGGGVGPPDVLRWLALAVSVSARTGAPAADCVDGLAGAVRAELVAADERAGALAGPRATAQVLAWLPAGGVVLGVLVGADPVRTLLLTGPGRLCLVTGAGLWFAGRAWTAALVRAAAGSGG